MDKKYVFDEFQTKFKEPKVETYEAVMELVGMNKQVRQWHKELKYTQATLEEMPKAYKDSGMTADEWDKLSVQRDILKNANKEYAKDANKASIDFQKAMKDADDSRSIKLAKVEDIIKLTAITITELPMSTQISLLMIKDGKERREATKARVDEYVTGLLKEIKEEGKLKKDPFV